MSTTPEQRAEWTLLADAAGPGPWQHFEGDLEGKPASEYVRTLLANREADGTSTGQLFLVLGPNTVDPENGPEVVPALTGDGPYSEANAAFIAAARDAVPALLADLEAAEQERDEAVNLLRAPMQYDDGRGPTDLRELVQTYIDYHGSACAFKPRAERAEQERDDERARADENLAAAQTWQAEAEKAQAELEVAEATLSLANDVSEQGWAEVKRLRDGIEALLPAGPYQPWDREKHLGQPPWKQSQALIAWETAHGHDVRQKCYPEFGCQLATVDATELRALLDGDDT